MGDADDLDFVDSTGVYEVLLPMLVMRNIFIGSEFVIWIVRLMLKTRPSPPLWHFTKRQSAQTQL